MKVHTQTLSEEQTNAVFSNKNVLLTAIPGSGKTRTLINKVLYEYSPDKLEKSIAITYTRRAADEIEDRIVNQIGDMPENIWVGTIHKFCLEYIVRGYSSYSEHFSKKFQIMGEQDTRELQQDLKTKYGANNYEEIDFTLNSSGQPNEVIYNELVKEYYRMIFKLNKIDFNYILFESFKILNENEHIRKQLATKIDLICIDEFQDTQELQYQILSLMANENMDIKIFIVGDVNQAIYDGVGGVVKTIEDLSTIFRRDFEDLTLTRCYRSNQEVIDFYRNFAVNDKDMKSKNSKWLNPEIKINDKLTKNEVFEDIFSKIDHLIKEGYNPNEIAVVAPQWTHLYEFANKFKSKFPEIQMDAPNIVPLKRDEDNIIYKISKIILTNINYFNIRKIRYIAKDIIKQFNDDYGYEFKEGSIDFINKIIKSKTNESIGTKYLEETLRNLFEKIGLYQEFRHEIDSFIKGTQDRINKYEEFGLEDDKLFFEQSLRSKSGVVISTAHGIKGEEYAVVFAYGLLEGYIPHWSDKFRRVPNRDEIARRKSKKLLFVITSRAKEKLFLYSEIDRLTTTKKAYEVNEEINEMINKGY